MPPIFDQEFCNIHCDECIENCPQEALSRDGSGAMAVNMEKCVDCGLCLTSCTEGAIEM